MNLRKRANRPNRLNLLSWTLRRGLRSNFLRKIRVWCQFLAFAYAKFLWRRSATIARILFSGLSKEKCDGHPLRKATTWQAATPLQKIPLHATAGSSSLVAHFL